MAREVLHDDPVLACVARKTMLGLLLEDLGIVKAIRLGDL
jgi:hypothetical protein